MKENKTRKPRIGVTPLFDEQRDSLWMHPAYVKAVEAAGGAPFLFPLTNDRDELSALLELTDGLFFTGGQDVDPSLYGEARGPHCEPPCAVRDELESVLFSLGLERDKPMLGICRGFQIINVLSGGTLYQDLPTELPSGLTHDQKPPYDNAVHTVAVAPESPLRAIAGESTLNVNSLHHQGIQKLSPQLRSMAASPEGLTEAFYMPDRRFVMGVQWHPEFLYTKDKASLRIFEALMQACLES